MATTLSDQELQRQLGDPRANLRHPLARPVVWAVLICLLSFIGWAAWAHIAVVTHGEGRVIPVSRIQSIQSLEGGIIEDLKVREGDIVDKDQLLVQLSGTRFRSAYQETQNQVQALRAAIARLQAEVLEQDSITFPESVDAQSSLAQSERELFHARREKLREATESLDHEIQMAQRRLNLIQPLVKRKAVSEMEALQL
ncbi:hypothetical protein ACUN9V_02035 [Salinicola sp. V024]